MPKYLAPIDLSQFELQNAVAQNLASAPSNPKPGQFYLDTTVNPKVLYWWDGSAWQAAKSGAAITYGSPAASAVGDTAADGSATTVARSDHKHAREPFGAPTSQTSFGASASTGTSTSVPHADHTHGTPVHDAAAHSGISLSALAAPTGPLAIGQRLTGVTDPSAAQDAATKAYVDNARAGLSVKDPVRVASTANVAVTTGLAAGQVLDGITLATGDRVLLKNQTTASENGIYVVPASGTASRATDADGNGEIVDGTAVWVSSGTTQGDTRWVATTVAANPWVPGSTSTTWTMDFAATTQTAGSGLTASGNSLNVGAGTGIVVGADTVSVDRATNGATVPLKYSQPIGDGAATSIVVTHNLGTQDVNVTLYANGAPYAEVLPDIQHTSTNTVTLIFGSAPASNAYRVVVIG